MKERIIGIDLGTSNSAAAVMIDGKLKIIPSSDGSSAYGKTHPSYVGLSESGDFLVGEPARRQALLLPQQTVKEIKDEWVNE